MGKFDEIIKEGIARRASDIHLFDVYQPKIVIDGQFNSTSIVTDASDMEEFLLDHGIRLDPGKKSKDFALTIDGWRLRGNYYKTISGQNIVFRILAKDIPTFEQLRLPKQVQEIADLRQGLVLVAGITGSGKSTTLASIIEKINTTRTAHVITAEDPIEYVYTPKKCIFSQREVGEHVDSFADATIDALRQNPDIVVVGEMRDTQTISEGIRLAQTGHLVFATVHCDSAVGVPNRMIDMFPEGQQQQIRSEIVNVLEVVVHQHLMRGKHGGRVPLLEVMRLQPNMRALLGNVHGKPESVRDLLRSNFERGCLHRADCGRMLLQEDLVDPTLLKSYLGESDFVIAMGR